MLKRAAGPVATLVLVAIAATIIATMSKTLPAMKVLAARAGSAATIGAPTSTGSHPVTGDLNATPVRLVIPSIHVNANIEARGLDSRRNLDTASDPNDVAWYDLGPVPGQAGNAIMNGHVDWWTGDAVFTKLGAVRLGQTVSVVRADGRVLTFRIALLQRVGAGARLASLFAHSDHATLTLITCAGVWNPITFSNTQRLLVTATLVS